MEGDYAPFADRLAFETAKLLYKKEQMSAGKIDKLMDLWTASLLKHHNVGPFKNHNELYKTIDEIPLGNVPWQSFTMEYNGEQPGGQALS